MTLLSPVRWCRQLKVRLAEDRAAVVVELAMVLPIFMLLITAMFDIGMAFHSSRKVESTTRDAARIGAAASDDRLADYEILRTVKSVYDVSGDDVLAVTVYRSSPGTEGVVPANCGVGDPGVADVCNTYTAAQLLALDASSFDSPTCSGDPDALWCPVDRADAFAAGDFLGVKVWVDHTALLGFYFDEGRFGRTAVFQLDKAEDLPLPNGACYATIYSDFGSTGASRGFGFGEVNIAGTLNNAASSIVVEGGGCVAFVTDSWNGDGDCRTYTAGASDMGDFDDRASYIWVGIPPTPSCASVRSPECLATFHSDVDFGGDEVTYADGGYNLIAPMDNTISSVDITDADGLGCIVVVSDGPDGTGDCRIITADDNDLSNISFDDEASHVWVGAPPGPACDPCISGASVADYVVISGEASYDANTRVFTVTPDLFNQSGTVMSDERIDLRQDFAISFEVYLGNDDAGADGMAFLFHDDPAGVNALGSHGGGLGVAGITNSVAIEFDTHQNASQPGMDDIVNDHTAIYDPETTTTDVIDPQFEYYLGSERLSPLVDLGDIENNTWREAAVEWDADLQTLSYTLAGAPMANLAIDLVGNHMNSDFAHFGFAGSTGSLRNLQQLRFTDFAAELEDGDGTCEPLVTGNLPPTIDPIPSQIDEVDVTIPGLTATATDPEGDPLTFTGVGFPPGITLDPDGTISGTPTSPGIFTVTVTVTDPSGGTDSVTFQWEITDPDCTEQPGSIASWVHITNVNGANAFVNTQDQDGRVLEFPIDDASADLAFWDAGVDGVNVAIVDGQGLAEVVGPGIGGYRLDNIDGSTGSANLADVDEADFIGAYYEGDYLEYGFTTVAGLPLTYLDSVSFLDVPSAAWSSDYQRTVIITDDDMATFYALDEDFAAVAGADGFPDIFPIGNEGFQLEAGTDYQVRVYAYGSGGADVVVDDFGLQVRQGVDCTGDPQTPYDPCQPGDTDCDGVPDDDDLDDDNDGISDIDEGDGLVDTDGDGVPDSQDPDSDNDGISDLVESGQDPSAVDTNGDGELDDMDQNDPADNNDADDDGLSDAVETINGPDTGYTPPDTDTDGTPDYRDLDSDDDGIPDVVEAQPTTGYIPASGVDADGDGIDDAWDSTDGFGGDFAVGGVPLDTDNDGAPDYLDTDSDADGFSDTDESGLTLTGSDANGDGIDDGVNASYADPDGDVNDPPNDLDNELGDTTEVAYREADDTDDDGVPDTIDIDDDNDGIIDTDEPGVGVYLARESFESPPTAVAGTPDLHGTTPQFGLNERAAHGDFFIGLHSLMTDGTEPFEIMSLEFATPLNAGEGYQLTFSQAVAALDPGSVSGSWAAENYGDNPGFFELWAGNASGDQAELIRTSTLLGGDDGQWHTDSSIYTASATFTHLTIIPLGTTALAPYLIMDDLRFVSLSDIVEDTDGDGIPNSLDLDSDNDGISDLLESGQDPTVVDTNGDGELDDMDFADNADNNDANNNGLSDAVEAANGIGIGVTPANSDFGVVCVDYLNGADGTFESLAAVADNENPNGNVTGGGWFNGEGTADSWVSPMPTTGSGYPTGFADGTPPSPNGGVFAGLYHSTGTYKESFYTDLTGLTVGEEYEVGFWQTNAGVDGLTPLNEVMRILVDFGSTRKPAAEMPYLGESNQVWEWEALTFTAQTENERLEFTSFRGSDGSGDLEVMGIDGIVVRQTTGEICVPDDVIADYIDLDSDNDAIPDVVEGQPTTGYVPLSGADGDGDGVDDAWDSTVGFGGDFVNTGTAVDTDGDSTEDFRDTDAEDDAASDVGESGLTLTGTDTGADGIDDGVGASFADPDGVVDAPPTDLTNELGDTTEVAYREARDSDGDGVADAVDIDDDNDGITDIVEADSYSAFLINEGFDSFVPSVANVTWSGPGNAYAFDEANVAGWETTAADNQIEIWESGHSGVASQAGIGHAEINAYVNAALFQDFATPPGAVLEWSIWHRGRSGIDVAEVLIGDPSTPIASLPVVATMITDTEWINYRGTYVVPAGQTTTRLAFSAISTASGSPSVGNLLDSMSIRMLALDTDGDGVPNSLDPDSDNDGISDLLESGQTPLSVDTDGDGELDDMDFANDALNNDANGNGLSDAVEAIHSDGVGYTPANADETVCPNVGLCQPGDVIPDFLDLDSDYDGIPDVVEGQLTTGYVGFSGSDADGDGIDDAWDSTVGFGGDFTSTGDAIDTDLDGTRDFRDADSDEDSLLDSAESGITLSEADADNNGIDDALNADYADPDGDINDPTIDLANEGGDTSEVGYRETDDNDGDGISNELDIDDDNDGILDVVEVECASGSSVSAYLTASSAAYDAAGDDEWVAITAAEYVAMNSGVADTTVFGTPAGSEKTGVLASFGGGAVYTFGHTNNPSPANVYVYAFKRAGTDQTAGGDDLVRLSTSNSGTGFAQYGSVLPTGTVESQEEHWVIKNPSTLQTSPVYLGLTTNDNNPMYYDANNTTGLYQSGSTTTVVSNNNYGWSMQGLATPTLEGGCAPVNVCFEGQGAGAFITTSSAAYDAAGADEWVAITAAEYAAVQAGVTGTAVFGTPAGSEQTGTYNNFANNTMYTFGHSTNPSPAGVYVYGFTRATGAAASGGNDVVRLSSSNGGTGFGQYGSVLPNGTIESGQEYFILKDPSTLQASAMYLGISTDANNPIYYDANNTAGYYQSGSTTGPLPNFFYGWSMQGLAAAQLTGECDPVTIPDTDGDGIPNNFDLDSDNDGISDLVESGQDASVVDTNGDGELDDMDNADRADNNDANSNGLSDAVEVIHGDGLGHQPADTDIDGVRDDHDLDSDNDRIPDVIEGQLTSSYVAFSNIDVDGDGVDDAWDSSIGFGGDFVSPVDTDGLGDGWDHIDTDADQDIYLDIDESGLGEVIYLTVAHSGKCLEVSGAGLNNGDSLVQSTCTGATNQQFEVVDVTGGFMLRAVHSGKCVDVQAGSLSDGANIHQWDCVASSNQILTWSGTMLAFDHSGKCIDVSGGGLNDGDNFHQWTCNNTTNQQFTTSTDFDGDGIVDGVGASYADPDGSVNDPSADLYNSPGTDTSEVAYREVTDTDGDGIADGVDIDDDNDGILDTVECPMLAPPVQVLQGSVSIGGVSYDLYDDGATVYDYSVFFAAAGVTASSPAVLAMITDLDLGVQNLGNPVDGILGVDFGGAYAADPAGPELITLNGGQAGSGPYDMRLKLDDGSFTNTITYSTSTYTGNAIKQFYETDGSLNPSTMYGTGATPVNFEDFTVPAGRSVTGFDLTNFLGAGIEYLGTFLTGFAAPVAGGGGCTLDTDGDGVANRIDLDSDNDGISDLVESGQNASVVDTNGDGELDDMDTLSPNDADNDGLSDAVEAAVGADSGYVPPDTDSDGLPDTFDLDSDNDGIPDVVEGQLTSSYVAFSNVDADGDGVDDAWDTTAGFGGDFPGGGLPVNTDGLADGADYIDTDAEEDAFDDAAESGLTLANADADGDGIDDAVNASYTDPDGDVNDPSSDLYNAPNTDSSEVAYRETTDTDGDDISDGYDLDDDNDGILDTVECGGGSSVAGFLSTSSAAYDAAGDDEWVAVTAAEYVAMNSGVADTTVFGTPAGSEKTGVLSSFGGGAMYTFGHSNNPSPANVYVYAFKRATAVTTTGGNDLVRLSTSNAGSGFTQYGSALPTGTVESQEEHWVIKNPSTLQTSPVYLGLSTDQNTSMYYQANNTTGYYQSGSTSALPNFAYGWSLQGLATTAALTGGSCDDSELDTDGDGVPNRIDLDSDNDGISDLIESGQDASAVDANGDGELDDMDTLSPNDADNDGLSDAVEAAVGADSGYTPPDTDSDGLPDTLDLDSDNDGIPDIVESQATDSYVQLSGIDADNDGIDDAFDSGAGHGGAFSLPVDTDSFGDGADYIDVDADGDTLSDSVESGLALGGSDANGDGIDDAVGASYTDPDGSVNDPQTDLANQAGTDTTEVAYREITDTDGDGISDTIDIDDDNDGISDVDEGGDFQDTDSDGTPDRLDLDSDNDGISDLIESGQDPAAVDTNNNGVVDDMDLGDPSLNNDADNDGLSDAIEAINGADTGYTPPDSDSDDLGDVRDLDSDNDGIPDTVEGQLTQGYLVLAGADDDGDGIDNAFDLINGHGGTMFIPVDSDIGFIDDGPDYLDTDSDVDGKFDIDESGLSLSTVDANGDGIDDGVGASYADPGGVVNDPPNDLANELDDNTEVAYREAIDTDDDGLPDGVDIDDDNDGVTDVVEDALEVNVVEGNHFWTVFQMNYYTTFGDDGYRQNVYLSGDPGTNVTVDGVSGVIPANGLYETTVNKIPSEGLHNNAFEISSDSPIVVVAESYAGYSSEAWVVLPTVTLGTEYTVIGYPTSVGSGTPGFDSHINVVASEDGTVAIIAGNAVALNAGQAYLYNVGGGDATGIAVTSNKPVAVVTGRRCLNTGGGACDIVGEQLFPDASLSSEYYVPAIPQPHTTRIVASQNDTDVFVNGTLVANLNKGSFHTQSGTGLHIETSRPTVVYMIALGGELPGDPVFVLLPGASNAVPDSTFSSPQPAYQNYVTVMAGTADTGSVRIDGAAVPNAWIQFPHDPTVSYQVISTTVGVHTLTADSAVIPIIYGEQNYGSYGYVAGFGNARIGGQTLNGDTAVDDTDGDGVLNSLDLDSDNDGMSDMTESGLDSRFYDVNNDGELDDMDFADDASNNDADDDGLSDAIEAVFGGDTGQSPVNGDSDGRTDYHDLDSDNDGIPDVIESQSTSEYVKAIDVAADGIENDDTDGDGVNDAWDDVVGFGASMNLPLNTDGDDEPDYRDTETDSDGVTDRLESGLTFTGIDDNFDGIDDNVDASFGDPDGTINDPTVDLPNGGGDTNEVAYRENDDTDGDLVSDAVDLDNDNDGILDVNEGGLGDVDQDDDAELNYYDLDSDNDGISDLIESGADASLYDLDNDGRYDGPVDGNGVPVDANLGVVPIDSDDDGIDDYKDLDSDNDTIPDAVEAQATSSYVNPVHINNIANDGVNDSGLFLPLDFDLDGTPDYLDLESDLDEILDIDEAGGGANPTASNVDGGINGSIPTGLPNDGSEFDFRIPIDSDGDLVPDFLDEDDDNDGVLDTIECLATDPFSRFLTSSSAAFAAAGDNEWVAITTAEYDALRTGIYTADTFGTREGFTKTGTLGSFAGGAQYTFGQSTGPSDGAGWVYAFKRGADEQTVGANDIVRVSTATDGTGFNQIGGVLPDGIVDAAEEHWVLKRPAAGQSDVSYIGLTTDQTSNIYHDAAFTDGWAVAGSTTDVSAAIAANGWSLQALTSGFEPGGTGAGCTDTDGDGISNRLDLDSDNDGLSDLLESGQDQALFDADNDGVHDNTSVDVNGVPDDAVGGSPADTDSDGFDDFVDLDSDDDLIPDAVEAQTTSGYTPATFANNASNQGLNDNGLFLPVNSETYLPDSTPDYLDDDSDNDTALDSTESGMTALGTSASGIDDVVNASYADPDGDINNPNTDLANEVGGTSEVGFREFQDTDGDAIPAAADLDDDNDGVLDTVEGGNTLDTDNDGVANKDDLDSDNDGISDLLESGQDQAAFDADNDGVHDNTSVDADGVPDDAVGGSPADTDSDGFDDFLDLDSDDDLIPDAVEAQSTNGYSPATFANNASNQGVNDNGLFVPVNSETYLADAAPDYVDDDSDNDTKPDSAESGMTGLGTSANGIDDVVNATYADPDGDINNPKTDLPNEVRGPSEVAFREFEDTDDDAIPAATDLDDDNDGILDTAEGGDTLDTDNDGVPNRIDLDSDNDGISDLLESGQDRAAFDADNDGVHDNTSVGADGVPDDAVGGSPSDTDSDGVDDFLDLDSDNDLIPDAVEAQSTNGYTPATFADNASNQGVNDNGLFLPVNSETYLPDSTPDYLDDDSDNDTALDSAESGMTALGTSASGIDDVVNATYADPDGDINNPNTDLPNEVGGSGQVAYREFEDFDNDNVPAAADLDDDNDGVLDTVEGGDTLDTDNDGVPNRTDLDSDNDGISDLLESGQDQAAFDADNDGVHDNASVDADGVPDDAVGGLPSDTDSDTVYDFLDLDSDNDLIPDAVEAQTTSGYTSATFANNASNQGVNDNGLFLPVNSEAYLPDSTPDYLDDDSDNDAIDDVNESGMTALGTSVSGIDDVVNATYADPDGDINNPNADLPNEVGGTSEVAFREFEDLDSDSIPAAVDLDDDNDGVLDTVEGGNTLDTDNDGVANKDDLDSDNDGISDLIESGQDHGSFDGDHNGVHDNTSVDASGVPDDAVGGSPSDTDSDGVDDFLDLDSDNDLIPDAVEAQTTNGYTSATFANNASNQGVNDNGLFLPLNSETYLPDSTPDYLDDDSDNDTALDSAESGMTALGTSASGIDDVVNATYADPDGDINDPNIDLPSEVGDSSEVAYREFEDFDNDNVPAFADLDDDNDGVLDTIEGGNTLDTDNDGVANKDDLDSDNDGISDLIESGQDQASFDANNDGIHDNTSVDANGVPDDASGGVTPANSDGDAIYDFLDLDSDGDLIPDAVEARATLGYNSSTFVGNAINRGVNDNGLFVPENSDTYLTDSLADYVDDDSDNDTKTDVNESGLVAAGTDLDGDGIDDALNASYADPDGNINSPNINLDNEVGGVAEVGYREIEDDDDDNVPALIDLDDDGDGITDTAEGSGLIDTDSDGRVDSKDLDSDNDGISDLTESGQDQSVVDVDNDGIHDGGVDLTGVAIAAAGGVTPVNSDSDGLADYVDLDSDDDLIPDAIEAVGTAAYAPATFAGNANNLGVNDNGLFIPADTFSGDATPDYRDTDTDDDGADDIFESGVTAAGTDLDNNGIDDVHNATYADPDGTLDDPDTGLQNEFGDTSEVAYRERIDEDADGVYSASDLDDDNDGITDAAEGGRLLDTDNDGVPNRIDLDSDNDSISDFMEAGQDQSTDDVDNNGRHDGGVDLDGVPTVAAGGVTPLNSDTDAIANYLDLDSDDDLIPDAVEARLTAGFAPSMMANNINSHGVNDDGIYLPVDTSLEGTPDYIDDDSDRDGAGDRIESGLTAVAADIDNDGIDDGIRASYANPAGDVFDPDAILANELGDTSEVAYRERGDNDGDGVFNAVDLDSDNDGVLDSDEGLMDTDGDSVPNYFDRDSDNDGISDLIESGQDASIVDTDNDGRHDGSTEPDGIPTAAAGGATPPNTDGDADLNTLDLDSDGDGIPDAIEAQATAGYSNPTHLNNASNEGVNDNGMFIPIDSEGDLTPDYIDDNSDTDNYSDADESGGGVTPTYLNVDGSINPAFLLGLPDNGVEFEFRVVTVICVEQPGTIASWMHTTNVSGANANTDTLAQDGRVTSFPVLDFSTDYEFWDGGGTGVDSNYVASAGSDAIIGAGIDNWDFENGGSSNLLHLEDLKEKDLNKAIDDDDYVEYQFTTAGAFDQTFINEVSFTDHPDPAWEDRYERAVLISDDNFATHTVLDQDYQAEEGLDILPDTYSISNTNFELLPSTDYQVRVYLYDARRDKATLDDFGIRVRTCN